MRSWRDQHIVWVDDEKGVRYMLRRYLEHNNHTVTTLENAQETLAFLDHAWIDRVVIDLVLPEGNGLDLLAEIHDPHPRLPCVVYTGIGFDDETVQEAKARGASV